LRERFEYCLFDLLFPAPCRCETWSADRADNGVETNTDGNIQKRLREGAMGGALSCVQSMKSQPVGMSHIPRYTKEEVGRSPLSDTAGMRLQRGTGRCKMKAC